MKIPEQYRERLFLALLGPVDRIPPGHIARILLEKYAALQLEDISPIIEELLDVIKRE